MASNGLGHGGVGSSRSANGFKGSSGSVEWLGREMLAMRLRDRVDHEGNDDDRVSFWKCLYLIWCLKFIMFLCIAELLLSWLISWKEYNCNST